MGLVKNAVLVLSLLGCVPVCAQDARGIRIIDFSSVYPMSVQEEWAAGRLLVDGVSNWFNGREARTTPLLATSRFMPCDRESLSINYWLLSDHQNKSRNWQPNEKNRGVGFYYSCDGWSVGYDRMKNSNNGDAELFSIFWGRKLVEVGPVWAGGKVGFGRISYEIPRYRVTLHDNSMLAFASFGLRQLPGFSVNVAKVPKTAGKAQILWISYELVRFR